MRGKHPIAVAVLLALAIGVTLAHSADAPTPAPGGATTENPAAAPTATPPAQPSTEPPAVTILDNQEVQGILGREVRSAANENMGRIVDVLVGHGGQVRAAVIDFGGFLGVGSRKIAVNWSDLHFFPPGKPDSAITVELSRDQVKAAPEYQDGKPVVVLGAQGKLEPLPNE